MASLLEGLNPQQIIIGKASLSLLENHRQLGNEIAKELQNFKDDMNKAKSFSEFFEINKKIIDYCSSITKKIFPNGKNFPDPETFASLHKALKNDKELSAILDAVDFVQSFREVTFTNKERLSLSSLQQELSQDEYQELVTCVHNITNLAPTAEAVSLQVKQFKRELETANSLDEIQSIETKIAQLQLSLEGVYQSAINLPKNENVAGALIKLLDTNFHLKDIMKTFNVQGNLRDDILYAESQCTNTQSTP